MLRIEIGGNKVAEIFTFLEDPRIDKKEFIINVINQIHFDDSIGFAGYRDKETLKKFLAWSIYGQECVSRWNRVSIKDCETEITFVLRRCLNVIQNKKITFFIFPTISTFVIDEMHGTSGFTPWKNTILLNVSRSVGWSTFFRDTVCHELAHALALNFNRRKTIEDDLIFEGIAEHFRESFLNGGKSALVNSISEKKAQQILRDIEPVLKRQDDHLYRELFFGTGKYPLWSGYAIGYYIVKAYLETLPHKNWIAILQQSPSEIIKRSRYVTPES
jgi:uncharacterized protein YjaZ